MLASLFHAVTISTALSAPLAVPIDTVFLDSALARPAIDARPTVPADTTRRRPRAIEYSDWYARRLLVHRYASYAMLPVFVGEYVYGQKLLNERTDAFDGRRDRISDGDRSIHQVFAGAVATLFGVNTITGLWNLYDARHDPAGRKLRVAHTVIMLASDAGFAATGVLASRASEGGLSDARTHRNVALVSMGVATVGTGMMWLFHH